MGLAPKWLQLMAASDGQGRRPAEEEVAEATEDGDESESNPELAPEAPAASLPLPLLAALPQTKRWGGGPAAELLMMWSAWNKY